MPPTAEYLRANVAQAGVNMLFGAASVISSLGLRHFNPILFGLLRAVITTIVLVLVRWDERLICWARSSVHSHDLLRFMASGFCLFVGEIFYIMGVELAGSIRASLWQPSQPIWTMAITALLGHEQLTLKKCVGILLAFTGCTIMVAGRGGGDDKGRLWIRALLGNLCLLINCSLGTPLYIIAVKPLLKKYSAFACAGFTFAINSTFFALALAFAPLAYANRELVPPTDIKDWLSVLYVAIFATVLPYSLQLWATRVLPASLVSAYYVLQPVAAAALVYTLMWLGLVHHLDGAQLSDLGSIAVVFGLVVVILETPPERQIPEDECRLTEDPEGVVSETYTAIHRATSPTNGQDSSKHKVSFD